MHTHTHARTHTLPHTHKQQGTTIWVIKNLLRPEARLAAPASTKGRYLCECACVCACVCVGATGKKVNCTWMNAATGRKVCFLIQSQETASESESWVLGVWK